VAIARRRKFLVLDERVTEGQVREFQTQQAEIARHLTAVFSDPKRQTDWWANYRTFPSQDGKNIILEKVSHRKTPTKHAQRRDRISIPINAWESVVLLLLKTDSWVRKHEKADALLDPALGLADPYRKNRDDDAAEGPGLQADGSRGQGQRQDDPHPHPARRAHPADGDHS
jgi:hypothetical protein